MDQAERLSALLCGEDDPIATLANAAAFLYQELDDLNWCGFYLFRAETGTLTVGPFQGKPACTRIAVGRGVCGTAFARNESVRVGNVHEFAGHIACDGASNSELVVPLRDVNGAPFAVLDLDSPTLNRFSAEDQRRVEELAAIIEKKIRPIHPR